MIKKIIITNYLGESIELELGAPEKSGLFVQSIEGLGPGKSNINTTEIATDDGSIFNSARSIERNIVMSLAFVQAPDISESIEDIRHLTYKFFPRKKPLTFTVETDTRTLSAYGYVESNEPNIFSNSETTQISIICPDPLFYSAGSEDTTFNGIDFEFEFPFDNNTVNLPISIIPGIATEDQIIVDELPEEGDPTKIYFVPVENQYTYFTEYIWFAQSEVWKSLGVHRYYMPEIEMGSIEVLKERTIYYDGDADTGVIISIHALGAAENITIYNTGTREQMTLDTDKLVTLTGAGITAGDEITISTIKGNKYIELLRNGRTYNILNIMDKNADWFQITKGDNIFTYVATSGAENLQFRILNQVAFDGV